MTGKASIFNPPENCWKVATAKKVAFLFDAAQYYSALTDAVSRARRSVLVAGWDLDSRIHLCREADGDPVTLKDFFNRTLEKNEELEIDLLIWDYYTFFFATERELISRFRLNWEGNERLRLWYDNEHPAGGSHHEKIVVIDDDLAFLGGLDLCQRRWDTPEHRVSDPHRIDPQGQEYGPFHDVQMALEGEIARELGRHLRERLKRVADREPPAGDPSHELWLSEVKADMEDVAVAIARTRGEFDTLEKIQEVKQLYGDLIGSARRSIYLESPYFTSQAIFECLLENLLEEEGPEIVLVTALKCQGWLEEKTMGAWRDRNLRALYEADRHQRFRAYYPRLTEQADVQQQVHAKIQIIDNDVVRVGSANLSNRSMGLDTECDLAIAATDEATEETIQKFRSSLLAEHLGKEASAVEQAYLRSGSLIEAIESLREGERTLVPLEGKPVESEWILEASDVYDPETPKGLKQIAGVLFPAISETISSLFSEEDREDREDESGKEDEEPVEELSSESGSIRSLRLIIWLATMAILFGLWFWSPLGEWVTPDKLASLDNSSNIGVVSLLIVVGVYVVASFLMVPITILLTATAFAFSTLTSIVYSVLGSATAALLTFAIARTVGKSAIQSLLGSKSAGISEQLGKEGLVAVIASRILPLGPFTFVNMVAGISHIRLRDFAIGTVVGMLPGIVLISVFEEQMRAAIENPTWKTFAVMAVIVSSFGLLVFFLRRRLKEDG